jgi:hypothetical protein
MAEAWAAIGKSGDYTLKVGTGTYTLDTGVQLSYSSAANIKISGLGSATYGSDVIIIGNPNTAKQNARELIYINGPGSLTLENITVRNTYGDGKTADSQAEAITTNGTGNLAAYNCSFLSHQDTIRTTAKAWFYKCLIKGDVDFLWMEASGTVALYEECKLIAVGDRVKNAYFTAPRANVTTKVGKGLVIYNSDLQIEDGVDAYLGRNPWTGVTTIYNQVAIINSPLSSGTINSAIWKSAANGISDQKNVGYKTDSKYAASTTGLGAVVDDTMVAKEYLGRKGILNRMYNTATSVYQADSETPWDVDFVISSNAWTVTADASSAGTAAATTVYDFTAAAGNGYIPPATVSGFKNHSSGSATGAAGSTITVPVTGKCTVYVKGFYSGYGTIAATDGTTTKGAVVYDFNNNSTSAVAEKAYVVYDASMKSVVITATSTSYITKVIVEYNDAITYVPVTGITVTAAKKDATVGVSDAMTAKITPANASNKDVVWSSDATGVATVNAITGIVKPVAAGSVNITATARDGSAVYGTVTLTVTAATWKQAEWYTTDAVLDAEGTEGGQFGFGSSSNKTLGATISFTNLAGTTISTAYGLKMNSSGTLTVSTTTAGTLTVIQYINTNIDGGLSVVGAAGTTVTAGSTSTSGSLKTLIFYLGGADTYTISRGSTTGENIPIVYATVTRGATPTTPCVYSLKGGVLGSAKSYTSDDTFLTVTANSDNNGHGLIMTAGNYFTAWSPAKAVITLANCAYDNSYTLQIKDSAGNIVIPTAISNTDYVTTVPSYDSSTGIVTIPAGSGGSNKKDTATTVISLGNTVAGTLTFTWASAAGQTYLHGVTIGAQ